MGDVPESDWELLERFSRRGDQGAFRDLVERHVNLVYGAARRSLGSGHGQLDDVVQAVFLLLSQKAGKLPRRGGAGGAVAGWLFGATRYCCANVIKGERRRRVREREVSAMRSETVEAEGSAGLEAILDEGLAALGERERQAILVRYLERKSAAETAGVLGISADAAEKRTERGLGKLRQFFRKRGFVVPAAAVAGLLAAESAKAAPAGLAARAAAVKVAAAGGAALVLAQGVMQMMRWMQIKFAVTCAGLALLLGVMAVVIAQTEAARVGIGGGPGGSGAGVAGRRPMMARWDLLMNKEGVDRVASPLTPVKTDSVGYSVFTGSAAAIRTAVAAAGKDVQVMPHEVGWASMNDGPQLSNSDFGLEAHWATGTVEINRAANERAVISAIAQGPVEVRSVKGGVRLELKRDLRAVNILLNGGTPVTPRNVRMNFAGEVPMGEAVVFAGLMVESSGVQVWQVSVWEAFAASEAEFAFVRRTGAEAWIADGAEKPLAAADRALAWALGGKKRLDEVPVGFEKKLGNGAIVRLAAVSRPGEWADCWWDAGGAAVAWDSKWDWSGARGDAGAALSVAVTAEDPSASDQEKAPAGTVMIRTGYIGPRRGLRVGSAPEGVPVEVGVAAGAWKDGGKMKMGEEVSAGGVRVKLKALEAAIRKGGGQTGTTWVKVEMTARDDVQMRLVALDKQGKEIGGREEGPEILFSRQAYAEMRESQDTVQADVADIAAVGVKWRAREWTTFAGFAERPVGVPGSALASAAASAPASAPGAGTPEAFMRALAAASAAADSKKMRGMLAADGEFAGQYADLMVDEVVSAQVVRAAAEAKFGKDETATAMGNMLPSMEYSIIAGWKVEGDRATPVYKEENAVIIGVGGSLVRVKGEWKMEVAVPAPVTEEMKAQLAKAVPEQAARGAAMRGLARDITTGKYKDAYEARDALVNLRGR